VWDPQAFWKIWRISACFGILSVYAENLNAEYVAAFLPVPSNTAGVWLTAEA